MTKQVSRLSLLFIVAVLFTLSFQACQQKENQDEQTAKEATEPKLEPLTNENVTETLTSYGQENPDSIVIISTRHGNIKVRLFKDTPLHRANFVRLTKSGFYKQGEFYRVLEDFMIQGGDSDSRTMELGSYRIPQEIRPQYFHKRGAVGMARYGDERNPEKESSAHNFYIVQGKIRTEEELRAYEAQHGITYTPEQREIYKTIGGAPNLDSEFTVFGEVIEGEEVIDKIASEPVDGQKWPKNIVPHQIRVE
ncbi:peptidylprolyl isomerase [Pontibacter harenae]|uniref:peptidylprolyl isomerase n=1 Tax=Pontibacter harenae TaxID=2894083 RepID=UPI001E37F06F|nr:peptidylprolyl isomerase [Pontibacter harenae]MCC9167667.1 peptidylprolyl isomerase [Pontibacter harenae]